jgi:hypothetical protein
VGDEEHLSTNCFLQKRDDDGVDFSVFGHLDVGDHEDCGSLLGSTWCLIGYFSGSYNIPHSEVDLISTQFEVETDFSAQSVRIR